MKTLDKKTKILNGRKLKRVNGDTAVNILLRTYFYAQSLIEDENVQESIITEVRKRIDTLNGTKKTKLKRAAAFEKTKTDNNVYKLFLDYVGVFGDL